MVARHETVNRSSSTSSETAGVVTDDGDVKVDTGTDDVDEGEDGLETRVLRRETLEQVLGGIGVRHRAGKALGRHVVTGSEEA
ncbi:unnamed protein product [Didymodactylos carnosus]|uniref:Uncharacterized protein n=1 Tax=Didymodactylos carnosus TaxID=1234261 RepID=A0A814WV84_9BILA|nr:unnamed protein product [Didymodactylos carnosus]CAF3974742.1 unnamed protein product [Didymodactylos carnosus]